jgi:hypothetical protein
MHEEFIYSIVQHRLGLIHKTDKSDAYMLARYGVAQNEQIHLWKPDDNNVINIIRLTRRLSVLEEGRLRENNRLEASEISDAHNRVLLVLLGS